MGKYDQEIEVFKANLTEWVAEHAGQFVLIKGKEVVGFFSTYADAVERGYDQYGLEGFFVRQISVVQQIQFMPPLMKVQSDGVLHAPN